jgi:hypothetical protein
MRRPREATGLTLEIGEDAIASLAPKLTKPLKKECLVIHDCSGW